MPETRTSEAGAFVRRARLKRKWAQQELATRLGWSQFKVSRVETGVTAVGVGDIDKLARVLNVRATKLLRLCKRAA